VPERLTARLLLAGLFAVAGLCACSHPADRAPPGYADACWGGRDNYPRYIAFTNRRLVVSVPATEEDWPRLSRIVKEVAAAHDLVVFDTSESGPHLRAVMVEGCHPSGISLMLDKRIWVNSAATDHHPGEVQIAIYTYRPDARFEPVEDTLVTKLQATWNDAKVERFPALPPSKKALPDTVHRLLVQECDGAPAPKPDYCEGL
jgi:hypothetical protein